MHKSYLLFIRRVIQNWSQCKSDCCLGLVVWVSMKTTVFLFRKEVRVFPKLFACSWKVGWGEEVRNSFWVDISYSKIFFKQNCFCWGSFTIIRLCLLSTIFLGAAVQVISYLFPMQTKLIVWWIAFSPRPKKCCSHISEDQSVSQETVFNSRL